MFFMLSHLVRNIDAQRFGWLFRQLGGEILKAVAQLIGGEVWLESSIFKGEMSSAAKCNDTVSTP